VEGKYRVFISARSDLTEEREVAKSAVRQAGWTSEDMSDWPPGSRPPDVTIKDRLSGCTFFVLLAGLTYGAHAPGKRISYVQREHQLAKELGIPIIVLMQDAGSDKAVESEQKAFRDRLVRDHTAKTWCKASDIAPLVLSGLLETVKRESATVFADNAALRDEISRFLDRPRTDRGTLVAHLIQYSGHNAINLVKLLLSKKIHTKLYVKCPGKQYKLSTHQEKRITETIEVQIWNELQHVGKDVKVGELLEIYGYQAPGAMRALLIDRIRRGGGSGGGVGEHQLVAIGAYTYMNERIKRQWMLDIRGGDMPGVILAPGHPGFEVAARMVADTVENWENIKKPYSVLKRFRRNHTTGETAWVGTGNDEAEAGRDPVSK
jgi:hypothetical protein